VNVDGPKSRRMSTQQIHGTRCGCLLTAFCLLLALPIMAAQAQSVVLPQISGVVAAPACASSANGTGHMICVISDSNHNLTAVSLLTKAGGFASPALDPQNPLPLGVVGTVASCASTADATGDVVCGYSGTTAAGGTGLFGIRFNIFSGTVYPVETLPPDGGSFSSCVTGAPRFTVTGPPAQEGITGATLCASRNHNGWFEGYAFNPATGYSKLLSTNGSTESIGGLSCTNANDGSNQVICALPRGIFQGGSWVAETMAGIAFDPRAPFITPLQTLFSGTQFPPFSVPGCATADKSGQVICAIQGNSNTLFGYAFDPRSGYVSALQTLGTTTVSGSPNCSGLADGSNQVICVFNTSAGEVTSVKFDPRTGANSGLVNAGIVSSEANGVAIGLSCTFQNINPDQISCAGVTTTANNLFGIVVNP
jgi:hypothetical protein